MVIYQMDACRRVQSLASLIAGNGPFDLEFQTEYVHYVYVACVRSWFLHCPLLLDRTIYCFMDGG